jgi:hypothetical protein
MRRSASAFHLELESGEHGYVVHHAVSSSRWFGVRIID